MYIRLPDCSTMLPRDAEVYLIDPKPVDVHSMRQIHVIQKGASEGVQELRSLLKP